MRTSTSCTWCARCIPRRRCAACRPAGAAALLAALEPEPRGLYAGPFVRLSPYGDGHAVVSLRGAVLDGRMRGAAGRRRHRRGLRRRRRTGRDAGQAAQRARRLPGRRLSAPADDLHSAWAQTVRRRAGAVRRRTRRDQPGFAIHAAGAGAGGTAARHRAARRARGGLLRARPGARQRPAQRGAGHQRHGAGPLAAGGDGGARGRPAAAAAQRRPALGSAAGTGLADGRPGAAVRRSTPMPSSNSACPTHTRRRCAPCRASPRRRCWRRSTRWPARCRSMPISASRWSRSRATAASPGGRASRRWRAPARRGCCRRWQRPHPQAVAELVARCAQRRAASSSPGRRRHRGRRLRGAVQRFVAASGYVLLAEATSQLRFGLTSGAPLLRRLRRAAALASVAPAPAPGTGAGDRRAGGVGAVAGLDRRRRRTGALGAAR